MNTSRKNAILNSGVAFACQLVNVLVNFVCRTVFTYSLGKSYLGVMGVFTNIITMLSLAEMGIDTAVTYRLYRPISEGDAVAIQRFLGFLRRFYAVLSIGFLVVGAAVTPFIPYLVSFPEVVEDVRLLFVLYILQTVSTYVFAYKKALLTASQKEYIVSILDQATNIAFTVIECVALALTKDYVLYCVLVIAYRLTSNLLCSRYATRKYPELLGSKSSRLSVSEKRDMKSDMKGLVMTRIATTAFNGTDSLFISYFLGVDLVGVLSNYTLILATLNTFVNRAFGAVTASIGNLSVERTPRDTENVLERMFFLNAFFFGFVFLIVTVSIRSFVTELWLGDSFDLPYITVLLVSIEVLLRSLHFPLKTSQNAIGLYAKYRLVAVFAAFLNLVLDYLLVLPLGVDGLYISTIFCRLLISTVDIFVVYRLGFHKNPTAYFKMFLGWLLFYFACLVLTQFILQFVPLNGFMGVLLRGVTATFVYLCGFLLLFSRSRHYLQFRDVLHKQISCLRRRGT